MTKDKKQINNKTQLANIKLLNWHSGLRFFVLLFVYYLFFMI